MRRKIIKYLLKLLTKITPADNITELYDSNLETLIFRSFDNAEESKLLERRIAEMIFDAKYRKNVVAGKKPHEILNTYYELASKGDNSYQSKSLFRLLRQLGDPEVRKLKYRLKRNQ